MERVCSQRKREVREEKSKETVKKKKDKWESMHYRQANNTCNVEIKGTLCSGACMGLLPLGNVQIPPGSPNHTLLGLQMYSNRVY